MTEGNVMRYVKWGLLTLWLAVVAGFLHYTLPQNDIVRIVNTEVRRVDFGVNSVFWSSAGSGDAVGTVNRDVPFIEAIRPNGKPIVYRNEDTGWGWPPYFKFNSSNLQAITRDMVSSQDNPRWVEIRHYGWRSELLSIFPNAISVRPATGPEDKSVNWFNMFFFTVLAAVLFALWRMWRRFRERRIDPVLEDIDEASDEARSRIKGWWRRISGR
jgi:hypothetical protein